MEKTQNEKNAARGTAEVGYSPSISEAALEATNTRTNILRQARRLPHITQEE